MKVLLHKIWENKVFQALLLFLLTCTALVSVSQGCRNAATYSQDFQWDAAKALLLKINPYQESLEPTGALNQGALKPFYDYFEGIGAPQKMEANQFPSLLMLLWPFALLPSAYAKFAWVLTNLFCTTGIIVLLRKTFLKNLDLFSFHVVILLMLSGTPYRNQMGVGQHTLFSFFFFLLAVWFFENTKRGGIPGTLALVISFFKYTLTVPLSLYFIYKRRWKELLAAVVVHVAMTGFSAYWLQESFFNMILQPLAVSSALKSEGGFDFGALFQGSPVAFVLAAIVLLLLLLAVLKTPAGNEAIVISVLTLWSLILTYHRTYDFFVMILVAVIFYEQEERDLTWLKAGYAVVIFTVFFVLRIFNESLPSRIVAGIFYYALTLAVTLLFYRKLNLRKKQ